MRVWHFSESAYPFLPDPSEYSSIRVTLPNRLFDPGVAAEQWDRYLAEWQLADELGLDVMLNEHHSTATCGDPAGPVMAGVLARLTSRSRIVLLGNPIANRPDPVRVAEEMALVDVLSHGRLTVGFVRGVPYEIPATNTSPVRMTERMWEAHDLIKKAWTTHDGPFNWQGRFFEHRQVNIWPRPYQQPHPPIWVTSSSPGSAAEIADRGYTMATFLTGLDGTKTIFDAYRARRAELGDPEPAPEQFAYLALVSVGRTDEEGLEGARKLTWYITSNKVAPQFAQPPGYLSVAAHAAALKGLKPRGAARDLTFEQLIEQGIIFAGNPDTVVGQVRRFADHVGGLGHLLVMGQAGFLDHEETVRSMRLLAGEVYPRVREYVPVAQA
ncbi:MAG: LLM class flavin-dependent oxidoreductase [Candidatus Dormibacteraeota bacterium]|nr:LLM class flavin-dependent oxidoreductase [Candidatus Dormibacteraeota bacterium]MBO0760926.1 LLM class flavin-dependent oxidoreductase [Candidatus Dormibacteraeota bacterium]